MFVSLGCLVGRGEHDDTSGPGDPGRAPEAARSTGGPATSPAGGVELECATLPVPLDHEDPDGETIDIALARVPATDPDERIGSLVFNPGGPGGSGIDFLSSAAVAVPTEISERFDLVGFDPRGVGASTARRVRHRDRRQHRRCSKPATTTAGTHSLDEADGQCRHLPGRRRSTLAPYVGTNNAARDLDLIREALGDEQLSYVGFSYGTRLGATYAELFPENVRALVLDGGVKPTDDFAELDRGTGRRVRPGVRELRRRLRRRRRLRAERARARRSTSMRGSSSEIAEVGSFATDDPDRVLTPGELQLGVAAALYSKDAWPYLAEALYLAETEQDGTLLQVLGDGLVGRQPDGTYDN